MQFILALILILYGSEIYGSNIYGSVVLMVTVLLKGEDYGLQLIILVFILRFNLPIWDVLKA